MSKKLGQALHDSPGIVVTADEGEPVGVMVSLEEFARLARAPQYADREICERLIADALEGLERDIADMASEEQKDYRALLASVDDNPPEAAKS